MSDRDRDIKSPLSEALVDRRLAAKAARETPVWEHAPAAPMRVPGGAPAAPQGPYRGRGPRGYARSPARIYEDLCDRLTENPFIDASEIEVTARRRDRGPPTGNSPPRAFPRRARCGAGAYRATRCPRRSRSRAHPCAGRGP